MATPNRILKLQDPEESRERSLAAFARAKKKHRPGSVVLHDVREEVPAGDPASESGVKVSFSELDDDLQAQIVGGVLRIRERDGSPDIDPVTVIRVPNDSLSEPVAGEADLDYARAFEIREVILTFSATVAPGTPFNIQTGVYAGAGSPAAVALDTNVVLPASGATYSDDGRIEVHFNGVEQEKGAFLGAAEADWVSSTQIALSARIRPGNQVRVRAPFPTA